MKEKVLNWVQRFSTFSFLDNHRYQLHPHTQECLVGAGVKRQVQAMAGNALEQLQAWLDERPSWAFGHLGYELNNEIEQPHAALPERLYFPDLFFFEPEIVVRFDESSLSIEAEDPSAVYDAINNTNPLPAVDSNPVMLESRAGRASYLTTLHRLQEHILRGDCYEINFCQEFFAEGAVIHPLQVYQALSILSPSPFSGLYRLDDRWLICASPERFLQREGDHLLSQPIKGTSRRISHNLAADEQSREALRHSAKDRSENVMIVDLVRNDLSKICREGTVGVEELYGIYSFPQVHQMISTIGGEVMPGLSFTDIIRATFPMGSMTGAPKRRVMELIAQYEQTRRGIFSGALGYISPSGDFDLNVVIRSIMYHAGNRYLSVMAGSGITFYSDPVQEWEECLMKIEGMSLALKGQ